MSNYDVSKWENLDPAEKYSAGKGWSRTSLLMKDDPFCSFFTSEHNTRLLNAFFSEEGLGVDHLTVHTVAQIEDCCSLVWAKIPHGSMFSEDWKNRITAHIVKGIFPEGDPIGERA